MNAQHADGQSPSPTDADRRALFISRLESMIADGITSGEAAPLEPVDELIAQFREKRRRELKG